MPNRREMLKRSATLASLMIAAGLLPAVARAQATPYPSAAFELNNMAALMKALGAAAPAESPDIMLQVPEIAENGAVVPITALTTLPGLKRLLVLVEKNPNLMAAMFEMSDAIEPAIATRVKMGQSSKVFAVAMLNDGRVLYAQKEVKVTLGGCGG